MSTPTVEQQWTAFLQSMAGENRIRTNEVGIQLILVRAVWEQTRELRRLRRSLWQVLDAGVRRLDEVGDVLEGIEKSLDNLDTTIERK